ncbi:MAG: hypothetical protein EPN33_09065 [Acidobacteria bacterium]|nr:MAG: hypothetical protein EPN33_09065 [Acidobacteriota bacterium]
MRDRRTTTFIALLFVSGLLLGGTFMNLAEHYWFHMHPHNEYDIRQHRKIATEMGRRLHLTPLQVTEVDAVLRDTIGRYQKLETQLAPQFDALRQRDRAQLRDLLTPAQQLEFDKIVRHADTEYPINERPAVLSPVPCESASNPQPQE